MKAVLLGIFAGILLTSIVKADEFRDGHWWAKLNHWQHQAYVTGIFDGMALEQEAMAGDQVSANVAWNQGNKIWHVLAGITSDELIRQIEIFYRDPKNLPVMSAEALYLVALQRQITSKQRQDLFNEVLQDARKRGKKGWLK